MRNARLRLSLVMIITTIILMLITFLSINYYQKNYIFDKAILSLESEFHAITSDTDFDLWFNDHERYYYVEILFLEDDTDLSHLLKSEKIFVDMYHNGDIIYDEVQKIKNEFGEYYVLLVDMDMDVFLDELDEYDDENDFIYKSSLDSRTTPMLLYTDITISNNIVSRLNIVFGIILMITVLTTGVVGLYLGSKFDDTQKKLKHFFQNASHELKSPLMSIQGYAEGIHSGVIDDVKMASEVIVNKSNKMKLLIDEILNISKLDSKEYLLKKEIIDIRDIIEDSLDNFSNVIDEKKLSVNVEYDSDYTEIKGDSLQIYKAVNTVIDNAVKYAFSNVTIQTQAKKSFLYIRIYNDGQNISKDNIKHIFDRFYSANDFSTGIGLAMAKEILSLSNGDISCRNVQDGVVMEMYIPLALT